MGENRMENICKKKKLCYFAQRFLQAKFLFSLFIFHLFFGLQSNSQTSWLDEKHINCLLMRISFLSFNFSVCSFRCDTFFALFMRHRDNEKVDRKEFLTLSSSHTIFPLCMFFFFNFWICINIVFFSHLINFSTFQIIKFIGKKVCAYVLQPPLLLFLLFFIQLSL